MPRLSLGGSKTQSTQYRGSVMNHDFVSRGDPYAASAPTLQCAPSESTNCASTPPKTFGSRGKTIPRFHPGCGLLSLTNLSDVFAPWHLLPVSNPSCPIRFSTSPESVAPLCAASAETWQIPAVPMSGRCYLVFW